MVSQQDIADKLRLSRSLVSKVLSAQLGTTKVRRETAELIRSTAREMGYRPNPTAVSLATGRNGTIGVLIRRIGHPASRLTDLLADGITEAAREHDLQLILLFYSDETDTRCLEYFSAANRVDGLLFGGLLSDGLWQRLSTDMSLPVVTVHTQKVKQGIPRVFVPNDRIGYLATRHLVERGCRRLALINTLSYRSEGFRQAMTEAGLPVRDRLVFEAKDFFHGTGEAAVQQFRQSRLVFDGIVAQSDEQAAGAINALLRAGVRVPEEVKVVGVDNSPFCEFCICPLSSVDQNIHQAGREAVRLLLSLIERPREITTSIEVEPLLIERESTRA